MSRSSNAALFSVLRRTPSLRPGVLHRVTVNEVTWDSTSLERPLVTSVAERLRSLAVGARMGVGDLAVAGVLIV